MIKKLDFSISREYLGITTVKLGRIEIRKLKKQKLEEKFIKMFISLLEYINQV